MQKYLVIVLVTLSPSLFASPYYVGLQYGITNVSQDYYTHFLQDNITLRPGGNEHLFAINFGYLVNKNWAIELEYNQGEVQDSYDMNHGLVNFTFPGQTTQQSSIHETEWEAKLKSNQLTLEGVYIVPLRKQLELNAKAGLTLSRYNYYATSHDEYEAINTDLEHSVPRIAEIRDSTTEVGGILSLAVEYQIYTNFKLGISAQYQFDNTSRTAGLLLGVSYHF